MPLSENQKIVLSSIVVLILTLGLILAAEALIRVRQYVKYGTASAVNMFERDGATGLRIPQPGMKTGSIEINSLGFRGPEIDFPKPDERLRLGFIGASTTYCAEVSGNDQVWSNLVSRGLEKRWPDLSVDYVNGGVPGYTTSESLINLDNRVLPLEPDVIVIYHATNDISGESRTLADRAGIQQTNLANEESWLSGYSLLWQLVEKNLSLMKLESSSDNQLLSFKPQELGSKFRDNLLLMIESAKKGGVSLVVLVTFSTHLRPDMNADQQDRAMVSARYYMPYISADSLLAAFDRYNQIIREVADMTGTLLIEQHAGIPGDPVHFNDSVHFTDAGSTLQAERIVNGLIESDEFSGLVESRLAASSDKE